MIALYVLNKNLKMVGLLEDYSSLVWYRKYADVGMCDIVTGASLEKIDLLQKGFYIIRPDDEMVCRITKVEIEPDDEENKLIVTGADVSGLLDQRIMRGVRLCKGSVESFVLQAVNDECIHPTDSDRQFQKENGEQLLKLAEPNAFTDRTTESLAYKNLGAKIREYCKTFSWGYRITWDRQNNILVFSLYKGADRSETVLFSARFDNLSTSKYADDCTRMGNVAIVSYITPYSAHYVTGDYGTPDKSVDRYEVYVDGRSINRQLTYSDLTARFPGGSSIAPYATYVAAVTVQIFTAAQKAYLQSEFTGTISVIDGVEYFTTSSAVTIADLPNNDNGNHMPAANDPAILRPIVYEPYLYAAGQEAVKQYGEKVTFEGTVIPDVTFKYKEDYFLGDVVKVQNEYGITATARIIEAIEVVNESGYSLELKFQYQS